MSSKISGIGLSGIEKKSLIAHKKAYESDLITLPIGGFYKFRFGGEKHSFEAQSIHMLQSAVGNNNFSLYKKYSSIIENLHPINIRDLLGYRSKEKKNKN